MLQSTHCTCQSVNTQFTAVITFYWHQCPACYSRYIVLARVSIPSSLQLSLSTGISVQLATVDTLYLPECQYPVHCSYHFLLASVSSLLQSIHCTCQSVNTQFTAVITFYWRHCPACCSRYFVLARVSIPSVM